MSAEKSEVFQWMVVGAGPAGIAAVGKLIDRGVRSDKICWMDPHFGVGDLGGKWSSVPSNTSVELFLRVLNNCDAFEFKEKSKKFHIEELSLKETCMLRDITEPLQWVTEHLKKKVHPIHDFAMAMSLSHGKWEVKTKHQSVFAKNVILAIGSDTKSLNLSGLEILSLETTLNREKLKLAVGKEDTVGVFGSSHSAILALANLLEAGVKQVINFYRSPLRYAVYLDDWILFDNTGLKGFTAKWAREHIDGKHPARLRRVLSSDHTYEESVALCNKVVYAVGFESRKLPVLEQFEKLNYDDKTGIIAPGLFGLGIAFPQAKFNPLWHLDLQVGLWKFMDYLNSILPIWFKYSN